MSKKLYFLISFVLVLFLAPAGYCGDARIDFDVATDPCVEPGFVGAHLTDAYIDVNGIIVDFLDKTYLEARRRPDPNSNNGVVGNINEEQIHRDFIYAAAQTSITFRIWGLGNGQDAVIHIWAFDDNSRNTPRRANWYGNDDYLFTTEFMGGIQLDWPIEIGSNFMDHYDFSATATADELGSIIFTCDINTLVNPYWGIAATESEPFAYLNALEVYPQGVAVPVPKPRRPVPFNESEDHPINEELSWIPGDGSATSNVYLSQDYDAVNTSNASAKITPVPIGANSITPPDYLQMDKIYYWRVNVVTPVPVNGDVWSFRTANHLLVDNCEQYSSENPPYDYWDDYAVNGTGSEIFEESTIALSGSKSIRVKYSNATYSTYSEVTLDITQAGVDLDPDLESMDAQSLSIWFYGEPNNTPTETMYAVLGDGTDLARVDYDGDMNDVNEQSWHEWNISFSAFNDANALDFSNIETITLGFDYGLPDDGNMYFDDIRFYTKRCVKVKRSAALAEADFAPVSNEDCIVDEEEVRIIGRDWLLADYKTDTCVPDLNGLVLYANFDEFNDINGIPMVQWEKHYALETGPNDPCYDGVMATRNLAPSPHPNSVWLLLSPIDSCDVMTTEGPVIIASPGVGEVIDNMPDGKCVHFQTDEGNPGERVTCGMFPVVGDFLPGTGTYGGGTSYQGKGKLTLAIWARWEGAKIRPKCQGLISKRTAWEDDGLIWMFEVDTIPGPRGSFSLRQRYGNYCLYSAAGILDLFIGQWVHLAAVADITNDSNEAILYLNGAEVQRGPFYFSGGDPNGIAMTIGNDGDYQSFWGVENWKGDLDEAYVFSRALEPNEIAYLADKTPLDGQLAVPVPSAANLINPEPQGQRYVNFRDYAVMANQWLIKEYWP